MWKYFYSGDDDLSSPGVAGPRLANLDLTPYPEMQLPRRAGSTNPSQSAISQRGCGLHTVPGGIDTGDHRIRPRDFGVVNFMEVFLIRGWESILPGCGEASAMARGATPPRAGSMNPGQSAISQWIWGFHNLRGVIDQGITLFVPRVLNLHKHGRIYDPGRGRDFILLGNSISPRTGSMSPVRFYPPRQLSLA